MGVIGAILDLVFGSGRNVVRETAEVFRENAEGGASRAHEQQTAAMAQFAAEFTRSQSGWFDRLIDGINRIPRPAMAFGTLGLFVAAMVDPLWFAERMQGIALVPEPLWWLLGVVVSFYFGARHQSKQQSFQREIAGTLARIPQVQRNIQAVQQMRSDAPGTADMRNDEPAAPVVLEVDRNPALEDWRALSRPPAATM